MPNHSLTHPLRACQHIRPQPVLATFACLLPSSRFPSRFSPGLSSLILSFCDVEYLYIKKFEMIDFNKIENGNGEETTTRP